MNKILWFCFDLRLHDNEAVKEALKVGKTLPIFPIVDNASSTKSSRDKIWKIKSSAESKILSQTVLQKHTSAVSNFP